MKIIREMRDQFREFEIGDQTTIHSVVASGINEMTRKLDQLEESAPIGIWFEPEDGEIWEATGGIKKDFARVSEHSAQYMARLIASETEKTLPPILALCAATASARSIALNHPDKGDVIDIMPSIYQTEEDLRCAVNHWLSAVARFEEKGFIEPGTVGKPLATNDTARTTCEIHRMEDVLRQGEPKKLFSDTQAREILASNAKNAPANEMV